MSQGYLYINVINEDQQSIEDALIVIYDENNAIYTPSTKLINTKNHIILPCPNISYSLSSSSIIRPYSIYTIEISHPSYHTERVEGVQIFSESTSVLDVPMTLKNEEPLRVNHTPIMDHRLYTGGSNNA